MTIDAKTVSDIGLLNDLANLAKMQAKIAEALQNEARMPCTEERRCLEQKGIGYMELDNRKMCSHCEVYWFADCARILLENAAKRGR
jgi:hypothetical protein